MICIFFLAQLNWAFLTACFAFMNVFLTCSGLFKATFCSIPISFLILFSFRISGGVLVGFFMLFLACFMDTISTDLLEYIRSSKVCKSWQFYIAMKDARYINAFHERKVLQWKNGISLITNLTFGLWTISSSLEQWLKIWFFTNIFCFFRFVWLKRTQNEVWLSNKADSLCSHQILI